MTRRDWDPTAPVTTAGRPGIEPLRVVVVGVGTVGLHHALAFADAGLDVVGYDVDESAVATYRRGVDATGTVGDDRVAASDCSFTADPSCVGDADVVLVSVPTRHGEQRAESVPTVRAASETVGEWLTAETTVVLESTVPPGATAAVFTPTLEAAAGMTAGDEFAVAHSPVRLSPGGPPDDWRSRSKLVGAERSGVAWDVAALYKTVYDAVHVVADASVAAAAKCVENVHRDVNVAVVNELAPALDALGLDADAVLDAAATKWNVDRLEPGLVGGTCLPEDPRLFADRVERAGASMPLVRTARAVNDAVPERVADTTVEALATARSAADSRNEARRGAARPDGSGNAARASGVRTDADGSRASGGRVDAGGSEAADADGNEVAAADDADAPRVLLLGLAYKPGVADLAGTKSTAVAERLAARGVEPVGYDPVVEPEAAGRVCSFEVRTERPFEDVDGVVVLVGHDVFADLTLGDVTAWCPGRPVVVDLPRVFDRNSAARSDIVYRCP